MYHWQLSRYILDLEFFKLWHWIKFLCIKISFLLFENFKIWHLRGIIPLLISVDGKMTDRPKNQILSLKNTHEWNVMEKKKRKRWIEWGECHRQARNRIVVPVLTFVHCVPYRNKNFLLPFVSKAFFSLFSKTTNWYPWFLWVFAGVPLFRNSSGAHVNVFFKKYCCQASISPVFFYYVNKSIRYLKNTGEILAQQQYFLKIHGIWTTSPCKYHGGGDGNFCFPHILMVCPFSVPKTNMGMTPLKKKKKNPHSRQWQFDGIWQESVVILWSYNTVLYANFCQAKKIYICSIFYLSKFG